MEASSFNSYQVAQYPGKINSSRSDLHRDPNDKSIKLTVTPEHISIPHLSDVNENKLDNVKDLTSQSNSKNLGNGNILKTWQKVALIALMLLMIPGSAGFIVATFVGIPVLTAIAGAAMLLAIASSIPAFTTLAPDSVQHEQRELIQAQKDQENNSFVGNKTL